MTPRYQNAKNHARLSNDADCWVSNHMEPNPTRSGLPERLLNYVSAFDSFYRKAKQTILQLLELPPWSLGFPIVDGLHRLAMLRP